MLSGERGFSLIEVLVAAGLLGLVLLGIASLFATAQKNIGEHGDYRQGLQIAQSEIEGILKLPPGDPKLWDDDPSGVRIAAGSVIDARDAAGYVTILDKKVYWDPAGCAGLLALPGTPCEGLYRRIAWVDDPNFDLDGTGKDYKKVTVVVAWKDPLSDPAAPRMNRVDLESYVAK
jgi:prepilin-type N-terminal cleavage/methylation domain-containing protein